MKRSTLAVLLATSLAMLTSCDQKADQTPSGNPLIGQWKIDSVAAADSNDIGALLLAMSLKDSSDFDMSFTFDSVHLFLKDTVTKTAYTFNAKQEQLLIQEDSSVFKYQQIDSNYIKLTDKDSTTLFLRKRQ